MGLSQRCVRKCTLSEHISGLCERNYCETVSCSFATSWNLLSRICVFRVPKIAKSLGAVTAHNPIDGSLFTEIWIAVPRTSSVKFRLCIQWYPSFRPSEEAPCWSQIPKLCGSSGSSLCGSVGKTHSSVLKRVHWLHVADANLQGYYVEK